LVQPVTGFHVAPAEPSWPRIHSIFVALLMVTSGPVSRASRSATLDLVETIALADGDLVWVFPT
jgi:hypothetical protein